MAISTLSMCQKMTRLSDIRLLKNLELSFKVKNVFDQQVEHPAFLADLASFNLNSLHPVYDIPAQGRKFVLSVKYGF